jgi:hypothetical protein
MLQHCIWKKWRTVSSWTPTHCKVQPVASWTGREGRRWSTIWRRPSKVTFNTWRLDCENTTLGLMLAWQWRPGSVMYTMPLCLIKMLEPWNLGSNIWFKGFATRYKQEDQGLFHHWKLLEQLIIFWSAPFYFVNASGESSCPRFRAAEFF